MPEPRHRIVEQERMGAYWYFPDLRGPDLSNEIVPGQHNALALLGEFTLSEIFSDDPEVEERVFGPETAD